MKKAKNEKEIWDKKLQESYEGKPHGWVQWEGTDVCMDVHCSCGSLTHVDGDYAYHVKCVSCGKTYFCNGHIELIEVEEEPSSFIITTDT